MQPELQESDDKSTEFANQLLEEEGRVCGLQRPALTDRYQTLTDRYQTLTDRYQTITDRYVAKNLHHYALSYMLQQFFATLPPINATQSNPRNVSNSRN